MKWITRKNVKVDRVACPWLIKKFVDSQADFVFLPHETDWASIQDGTVYDVPGCELGHHGEEVHSTRSSRNTGWQIQLSRFWQRSFVPPILILVTRTLPEKVFAELLTGSVRWD
jgi:hypothetical protein